MVILLSLIFDSNWFITASAAGMSIIVVAVFEIHMERKYAASIKPNRSLVGVSPTFFKIPLATLVCKCHFSIANAKTNPPIKRNMKSF